MRTDHSLTASGSMPGVCLARKGMHCRRHAWKGRMLGRGAWVAGNVCGGGVYGRGTCVGGRGVCIGGIHGRGCAWQGGMHGRGACVAGGMCGGGMHGRGVRQGHAWHTCPLPYMTPPWTEWLTDRCKNITFPQLRCGRNKYQLRSYDQKKQGSKILICFGHVKCAESPKKIEKSVVELPFQV